MLTLLIAWIGAAVVALVVMRQGLAAAGSVFLLALLPAGVVAYQGNIIPVSCMLTTAVLALQLRVTRSWATVISTAPFVIVAWTAALLFYGGEYLQHLMALLIDNVTVLQEQWRLVSEQAVSEQRGSQAANGNRFFELYLEQMQAVKQEDLAAGEGLQLMTLTLLSLVTARWWQAKLYNPGGFQQEFHQLRLSRGNIIILVLALLLFFSTELYQAWARFFAVPMIVAGIALAHGIVEIKKLGTLWLVLLYVLVTMLAPLLMMIAIIDSAIDFRGRLAAAKTE